MPSKLNFPASQPKEFPDTTISKLCLDRLQLLQSSSSQTAWNPASLLYSLQSLVDIAFVCLPARNLPPSIRCCPSSGWLLGPCHLGSETNLLHAPFSLSSAGTLRSSAVCSYRFSVTIHSLLHSTITSSGPAPSHWIEQGATQRNETGHTHTAHVHTIHRGKSMITTGAGGKQESHTPHQ